MQQDDMRSEEEKRAEASEKGQQHTSNIEASDDQKNQEASETER